MLSHVFEQEQAFLKLSVNQSAYIIRSQLIRFRLLSLKMLLELTCRHTAVLEHALRGESGGLRLGDGAALDVINYGCCVAAPGMVRSRVVGMVWGVLAGHLRD